MSDHYNVCAVPNCDRYVSGCASYCYQHREPSDMTPEARAWVQEMLIAVTVIVLAEGLVSMLQLMPGKDNEIEFALGLLKRATELKNKLAANLPPELSR